MSRHSPTVVSRKRVDRPRAAQMHVTRLLVLLAVAAVWSPLPQAQETGSTSATDPIRVGVPSPTAASLARLAEVQAGLPSGGLDLAIPLGEVRGRHLSVPVSLQYHTTGVRVDEVEGWAGVGWTLLAGGAVTRTVRGLPDEVAPGYMNTGHRLYDPSVWDYVAVGAGTSTALQTFLRDVEEWRADPQPDAFFYVSPRGSARFAVPPPNLAARGIRTAPHSAVRIEWANPGWTVTDTDGTVYVYATAETSTQTGGDALSTYPWQTYVSSWFLTEIRTPTETAQFTYDFVRVEVAAGVTQERVRAQGEQCGVQSESTSYVTRSITDTVVLRRISVGDEEVEFVSSARPNGGYSGIQGTDVGHRKLDRVVFRRGGAVVRTFDLSFDEVASGDTRRLFLRSVQEAGADGTAVPPYTFAYASPSSLPSRLSYSQDHWGYANGAANTSLLPSRADRSPSASVYGVLTEVVYPTGGRETFAFGPNERAPSGFRPDGTYPGPGLPRSASVSVSGTQTGSQSSPFTVGPDGPADVRLSTTVTPSAPVGDVALDRVVTLDCPSEGVYVQTSSTEVRTVTLPAGTSCTLRADVYSWDGSASAAAIATWTDVAYVAPTDASSGPLAGGARVERRTTYAGAGAPAQTTDFVYRKDGGDGVSSGVAVEPYYETPLVADGCTGTVEASTSVVALGSAGSPVAYSEVVVRHGADGRTVKTYTTAQDDPGGGALIPTAETNYGWRGGHPLSERVFNADGDLVTATTNVYAQSTEADGAPTYETFRALALRLYQRGTLGLTVGQFVKYMTISAWHRPSSTSTTQHR